LRIADESLPGSWSCNVKVEEFTHFILLVYLPHNAPPPALSEVTTALQPIVNYCGSYLSDVAIFDRRHKSFLFFDSSMLQKVKSGQPLSKDMATRAANQGAMFTRFNSVTVDCEKYESHLLLPIEISGPNRIIGCRALLDTGASITMLSSEIISETGRDNLQDAPRRTFSTVNGTISCPIVMREINIGGIRKTIEVAVNQQDDLSLVGMNYFEGMDYIVDFGELAVYMWEK
jgi:predicted aspartyl protease